MKCPNFDDFDSGEMFAVVCRTKVNKLRTLLYFGSDKERADRAFQEWNFHIARDTRLYRFTVKRIDELETKDAHEEE